MVTRAELLRERQAAIAADDFELADEIETALGNRTWWGELPETEEVMLARRRLDDRKPS